MFLFVVIQCLAIDEATNGPADLAKMRAKSLPFGIGMLRDNALILLVYWERQPIVAAVSAVAVTNRNGCSG